MNKKTSSKTKKLGVGLLCLLSANVVNAASLVSVAEVEAWEKGMVQRFWCNVSTPNRYQISSHGNALLEWIKPIGSYVKQGEVLAQQQTYYLQRDVNTLELELAAANIEKDYERTELSRLQKLDRQVLSEFALQEQENKFKLAELKAKQLQQKLETSLYRLAHLAHQAPVDGVVVEMHVEPGESISQGQLLATIEPTEQRELQCQLPVKKYHELSGVAGLMSASYTLQDNGTLHYLRGNQIAATEKQVVNFILGFDAHQGSKPLVGERTLVEMSLPTSGLASVPYDALEITSGGYYIWHVKEDQSVDRLPVEMLFNINDKAIVRTQLVPGNQVITTGKRGLSVGDTVKVEQSPELMANQTAEGRYES
ncbi:efflux RND transporter periplasmic adaptor subunit [Pseudoalteromonas rubra]|uniref:efflux RND transporter periplasmic adaptor subunit n=1 Tax=Pseudoalteromonas rubra TaxID=43658 RepID=UPI000F7773A5|nr:efflux RND transporter periplasmic adaptor subunit [Pseudoalteromonas rubra]